jgi:hypothetical protein
MPAKAGIHALPAGSEVIKKRQGKRFFFEKKKQKTSAYCGPWGARASAPKDQKFFCFFFFKKRSACLSSLSF